MSSIEDRILQELRRIYPMEMRFQELREACLKPSKSAFAAALDRLEKKTLIIRTELSRKHVVYSVSEGKAKKIE